ncbi:hypothetical protein ELK40_03310 [Enterobacter sp. N18-03635]|uniref:hypothetical protein n=1 Tax=Enterobacter sp. N18-03635 TaxID=2500132 RepID=UPI000FD77429|nr:hypothetical protein [Enterobacter sp. N18-03635]AZV04199.1 hypothetical protein ELK40_03310 [Enterobacter sp. N18-03635]
MRPIHPLIKAARDKKLPHPAQLNEFKPEHWIKFMNEIGPLTAEASAYISGANWLNFHFQCVENTRKQICFLTGCKPEYHEMIRAHIASANYAFWQVCDEQDEKFDDISNTAIEQFITSKTSKVGKSDPVSVNSVNMHRLDSLRGPLFELFKYKDRMHILFPDDRPIKLSKLDLYLSEMKMSQHFHNFSSLWQDLLYGRAIFTYQHKRVFFMQCHSDYHRMKTIAEFRRDHFLATSITEARTIMDKFNNIHLFSTYLHFEPGKALSIVPWQTLSQRAQMIARFQPLSALIQLDDHLKALLTRKSLPCIERTLQSVLDVWVHLSVLAVQIDEKLHTNVSINDWSTLLHLAPQFERSIIIELLIQCCEYSKAEIIAALDLLTWKGKSPQEDLWVQPLVSIEDNYIFPISAFLTASLTRNIDCWMAKIDPKDTRRGSLFEKDLLRVLEECRNGNQVMKEHLHYTNAIEPSYHGHSEEIDLSFSFGNLLIVVEARSRKTSITPLDYDNELFDSNGLMHKTNQAIRKATFVREHLEHFCRDYYPHLSGTEKIEVIPLVIINGQFHAGFPLNDVPIIDPALLFHYLRDREVRFMATVPYDKHQYGIPLWQTLEEAQTRFKDYLSFPTLIKIYDSMCRESVKCSNNLGETFDEVVSLTYEIDFMGWQEQLAHVERVFPNQFVKYY